MAVMMGAMSYAQFSSPIMPRNLNAPKNGAKAQWAQISQPAFTTYDFRDTEQQHPISLQAWLDSGFSVVVDYSCCWCGPCWNLHEAGVLEGYYDRFGPNGTNEMRVIWIEIEATNTTAQITGTSTNQNHDGATWGDWTLGGTVPYPMADDRNALNCCSGLYAGTVPTVFFIAPNGYYRDIYGETDGIYSYDTAACNANMANILQNYPRAGQTPIVDIIAPTTAVNGSNVNFTANIVSVDPVTSINWTFQGATTTSATTANATTSWATDGTYTVTLEVTNANGTTTKTATIQIISWNWGNTMTYSSTGELINRIGTGGGAFEWGAMFPAQFINNRPFMKRVDFFAALAGNYTVNIYQGGDDAPATKIYNRTVNVTSSQLNDWVSVNMSGAVPLEQNKNLWVTIGTTNLDYPACAEVFSGDLNGSWVGLQNQWMHIQEAGDFDLTWMVRATTGATANEGINTLDNAEINLYPNPTTGMVRVDVEGLNSIEVIDMTGRVVMTSNQNSFDMSSLSNGVYMVRINTVNGNAMQKVVKR